MFSVYFLIKSTSAYSSESFDVSVSVRAGDGMGGSSGKITFDERGVSFGKVFIFCNKIWVSSTMWFIFEFIGFNL